MGTPNKPEPIDARIARLNELAESHPVYARLRGWLSQSCNPSVPSPVGQAMIELLALVKTLNFDEARRLVREEIKVRNAPPGEIAQRIFNRLKDTGEQCAASVTRPRARWKVNFEREVVQQTLHGMRRRT